MAMVSKAERDALVILKCAPILRSMVKPCTAFQRWLLALLALPSSPLEVVAVDLSGQSSTLPEYTWDLYEPAAMTRLQAPVNSDLAAYLLLHSRSIREAVCCLKAVKSSQGLPTQHTCLLLCVWAYRRPM